MQSSKLFFGLALVLLASCGGNPLKMKSAKTRSDALLEAIGNGTANDLFPETYFPKAQTAELLDALVQQCDFKNRRGNFINDFYAKNAMGTDQITDIYEFYLKCDTVRIMIGYLNEQTGLKLYQFHMEAQEMSNSMILRPDLQLKR